MSFNCKLLFQKKNHLRRQTGFITRIIKQLLETSIVIRNFPLYIKKAKKLKINYKNTRTYHRKPANA